VDGLSGELVYTQDNILARTDGLPRLLRLNMKEKAVLLYLTTYGMSTFEQISKRLKISDKDLNDILQKLVGQDFISKEDDKYESNLNLNFEDIIEKQINENPVNYKYTGDLLPFKIKKSHTDEVLSLFSPEAVERKMVYYPYWFVFYDDGTYEAIDALTGEKDKNLIINLENYIELSNFL
jgi:hypothetical protein